MHPLPGQRVLVVGLGKSGQSACAFLRQRGCRVRATERASSPALSALAQRLVVQGIQVEFGGHTETFCQGSTLVVVSPGVPSEAVPIRWALRRGVPVIGELELGARFCRGRLVAITGSNGKSTVTSMIGAMVRTAGQPTVVAGNIGEPLTGQLDRTGPGVTVVLEVSSFQLEWVEQFHPSIACVLNVTPNHLDRHQQFAAYAAAKRRLLTQQRAGDWAVLNADDPVCQSMYEAVQGHLLEFSRQRPVRGAYRSGTGLSLVLRERRYQVASVEDVQMAGAHNVTNALAAMAIGGLLGLEPEVLRRAIQTFRGLPHRLQRVAEWQGIVFVNDSKSTTVEAGLRALEACPGRAVLIAGGKDKGSDFTKLIPVAGRVLRGAVLIGVDGPSIARVLGPLVPTTSVRTMEEAVHAAASLARPGDWILLSPMCTSFDMFRDFEERGEVFHRAAEALVELESQPVLMAAS